MQEKASTLSELPTKDAAAPKLEQRLEDGFQFSQVGRCVNAVTHDVNNQLGAMMAYSEMLEMDASLGPDARRMLGKVSDAVTRCTKLIAELTNLARPLRPSLSLLDLGQTVQKILMLRDYEHRVKGMRVRIEAAPDMPSIMADGPQLSLAILYLVLNAEEAVAEAAEKDIELRVQPVEGGAELRIRDSGPPIDEAVRARMFEPLFTTKSGAHLGLGLSQATAIATAHGGSLRYAPEAGFILELPRQSTRTSQA